MKFAPLAVLGLAVAMPALAQNAPAPAAQPAPAPAAPAAAAAAKFNLDTPVEKILADPAGKAAFDAALPGVSARPELQQVITMSLRQISGFVPDQLTPEVLAKVEAALAAVK